MNFDRFTFGLYLRPARTPALDDERAATIQNEHLAFLAGLGRSGQLVAAGPFDDQDNPTLRGAMVFSTGVAEARSFSQDPAVRAGVLSFEFMSWLTPAGLVSFHAARFPESMEEATSEEPGERLRFTHRPKRRPGAHSSVFVARLSVSGVLPAGDDDQEHREGEHVARGCTTGRSCGARAPPGR